MKEYKPIYPNIKYPTDVDIAYKRAYGHYEYDNNFLKRFRVGYLLGYVEGVKDGKNLIEIDYPDY